MGDRVIPFFLGLLPHDTFLLSVCIHLVCVQIIFFNTFLLLEQRGDSHMHQAHDLLWKCIRRMLVFLFWDTCSPLWRRRYVNWMNVESSIHQINRWGHGRSPATARCAHRGDCESFLPLYWAMILPQLLRAFYGKLDSSKTINSVTVSLVFCCPPRFCISCTQPPAVKGLMPIKTIFIIWSGGCEFKSRVGGLACRFLRVLICVNV